ncbi:solute carrier family 25 member 51-like [Piliocolobus tephrosceles]|uniref:solute carrier family 25 member 51-like n=1 Tax=Piliocolobus tephrosceles TaxID=591936 RepID=UPI000E6B3F66|nr:solute carrier family 25 member 51-like [Piliocolobus tephrosceles]
MKKKDLKQHNGSRSSWKETTSTNIFKTRYVTSYYTFGEMKHYLCGCCATFNNVAITFPIQKVLFRQQLYGIKIRDATLQLRRDGFRNLYRGIFPRLMQQTTTLALTFGLYEDLSCLLHKHVSAPEFAIHGVIAVLAGTTEAIFTSDIASRPQAS